MCTPPYISAGAHRLDCTIITAFQSIRCRVRCPASSVITSLFPKEPLLRGFDDVFSAPHSRHTEVRAEDIRRDDRLRLLAESNEAGVYIVEAMNGRQIFVLGHGEYDSDTLKREYERDLAKGLNPDIPAHYFRNDDPDDEILVTWKAHAHLFYTNWVNYYVYQTTPYLLDRM